MSQAGNTAAAAAQSIGQEIVADATAFIQRTETALATDLEDAWTWLKNEIALLAPEVVADLKAAVATAVTEAVSTGSSGSVVTDTLNILARDGLAVLNQVKSDVVTGVVGLTTAKPTSP